MIQFKKFDKSFTEFIEIHEINDIRGKNLSKYIEQDPYIYVKNKNFISFLLHKGVNHFVFDENLINEKEVQFLSLINKTVSVKLDDKTLHVEKYINNPLISNILYFDKSIERNFNFASRRDYNHLVNIDVQNIFKYTGEDFNKTNVLNVIRKIWGHFSSYYIFNLPNNLSDSEIQDLYDFISSNLGRIVKCRPVNDNSEKISYSRDVKYVPNSKHFFSSNKYQPLHSDFAYFTYDKAPDYLTLYCLKKSEFGGITSLLSTETLRNILQKYNKQLFEKICVDFTYKSQVDEDNNYEIHDKKCFDLETNYINWNYFQIKEELNSKEKMSIRQEFFDFLNDFIWEGQMMDTNISWQRGDCLLFNDHLNLHTRSAFLGERWLSGNAFFF